MFAIALTSKKAEEDRIVSSGELLFLVPQRFVACIHYFTFSFDLSVAFLPLLGRQSDVATQKGKPKKKGCRDIGLAAGASDAASPRIPTLLQTKLPQRCPEPLCLCYGSAVSPGYTLVCA